MEATPGTTATKPTLVATITAVGDGRMKIKRGTKVTWRGLVNGKPRNRTGIFSYCIDHSDPWATPQALITAMDGGNGSARVEIDRLKVVKE